MKQVGLLFYYHIQIWAVWASTDVLGCLVSGHWSFGSLCILQMPRDPIRLVCGTWKLIKFIHFNVFSWGLLLKKICLGELLPTLGHVIVYRAVKVLETKAVFTLQANVAQIQLLLFFSHIQHILDFFNDSWNMTNLLFIYIWFKLNPGFFFNL